MASSKDSVNVEILFVEGVLDDHVKTNDMDDRVLYRIDRENRRFSV